MQWQVTTQKADGSERSIYGGTSERRARRRYQELAAKEFTVRLYADGDLVAEYFGTRERKAEQCGK